MMIKSNCSFNSKINWKIIYFEGYKIFFPSKSVTNLSVCYLWRNTTAITRNTAAITTSDHRIPSPLELDSGLFLWWWWACRNLLSLLWWPSSRDMAREFTKSVLASSPLSSSNSSSSSKSSLLYFLLSAANIASKSRPTKIVMMEL